MSDERDPRSTEDEAAPAAPLVEAARADAPDEPVGHDASDGAVEPDAADAARTDAAEPGTADDGGESEANAEPVADDGTAAPDDPGWEATGTQEESGDASGPRDAPQAETGGAAAARRTRRGAPWLRMGAGAVLSLVVAGAVVGASTADWPTVGGEAASIVVSPDAAPNVVTCDGPVLALGRDATAADEITAAADAEITVGATGAEEPEATDLDGVDLPDDAVAERYELRSADQGSLSASSSTDIRTEDISGFAASACRQAGMQTWVVGGSTALGATDILLLANPGPVNATAQLSVFGTEGPLPEGEPIAIPAMSQVALPLAGVAAGEAAPVVRVTAEGAPLRASLQSTEVRTLDPVGIDSQEAIEPAERQVFPGVLVAERAVENDVTPASVRVLSRETGAVTVTVTAEGEREPAETLALDAQADVPLEAALEGLDPGRYTVVVEGQAGPTVAAVRQTTGPTRQQDFAWQTPSPEVAGPVAVAVPAGPLAHVYVVNDGDDATSVTLTGGDVDEEFSLAPGEAHHVRVAADELYELAADGAPVRAAVTFRDGGSLASFPISPDPAASADLTVYP
ncbi:DUF5719 family protein [Microbacterium halophytorum]|uniref:DUF5719 family protein n=1 Tax=Microbacterium halophytorum TaxID=2067568 RepID=UPI000CFD9D9B|nr:DUF5719 family protein [Microbacterium halophytorum]